MIKVKVDGYTFTFADGTPKAERDAHIQTWLQEQNAKRQIIMRKSDGTEVHIGNGVRLHGQRH
jgi:hypothetical protein